MIQNMADTASVDAEVEPGSVGNLRVLCVDDDADVLVAIIRMVRGDFDVLAANSAQEGLRLLRTSGPFAAIVSDWDMPGMNGIEFLSRVATISPRTARIILTGSTESLAAEAERCRGKRGPFPSKAMRAPSAPGNASGCDRRATLSVSAALVRPLDKNCQRA